MSNQNKIAFQASDAFAYVDAYRNLILNDANHIESEKKRLEEKMWNMNVVSSRMQAEMRAHEHALAKVLEGTDPGTVVLDGSVGAGEADESGDDQEAIAAYQEQVKQLQRETESLKHKLRTAAAQEQELQTEVVRKKQEVNRLHRKLEQTYSSIYVVSATFGVIVLVLLVIRFLG